MTDSIGSTTSSAYSTYGLQSSTATTSASDLDEEDFLALMTAQIANQDPLNPADSSEYFAQIASFAQVSSLDELNLSMADLSTTMTSSLPLQATTLVGHEVLVASSTVQLDADGVSGAVETTSSGDVSVEITNEAGEVVRTLSLGDQSAGLVEFTWDGVDNQGNPVEAGEYKISATVSTADGSTAATTYVFGTVDSVTFEAEGMMLAVDGLGDIPFGSIRQIN